MSVRTWFYCGWNGCAWPIVFRKILKCYAMTPTMYNIEITLDFSSHDVCANNSNVFTWLHDYYSTTFEIRDFSPILYLHTRGWTFVLHTTTVNFRNCPYTNCQMATIVQSIRQSLHNGTHTRQCIYTYTCVVYRKVVVYSADKSAGTIFSVYLHRPRVKNFDLRISAQSFSRKLY